MKHASPATLDGLENILSALRKRPRLKEKKRGVFYHKSVAFLHFHEDSAGLFADVKVGHDFERLPVSTSEQQSAILNKVDGLLDKQEASHAP